MKYSNIFVYAYLAFAILFLYDGIAKYLNEGTIAYPSFLLAALAVFMFFFRRKFRNKYKNKDNSN
ncbi:hypothetical protein [Changchengzhania lutea]|uniref:hypothetical protein n=1 Tax=Changchengzhania lutea TaxID=2049305 RepID=UPI00115EC4A4|nr:hypothetical protein [Changchengzhania lutea]